MDKPFFDQPAQVYIRTYDNIRKITTGQGDYYTISCLLDYSYFKQYYTMIALDLRKQKALYTDPKSIEPINFTGNLERGENTTMFFINEEAKETILDFSQGTVRML